MRALLVVAALVFAFFGSSCSSDKAAQDAQIDKVSVADLRFFNSEKPTFEPSPMNNRLHYFDAKNLEFSAKPITYRAVESSSVFQALDKRLSAGGYTVVSDRTFFNSTFKRGKTDAAHLLIQITLKLTNHWLQTADKTCNECPTLTVAPLELATEWTASDRWIMIVGLETRSPNNRGLRSGLAAFMFDGTGTYVDHQFEEYNFKTLNTKAYADKIDTLITGLGLTLGPQTVDFPDPNPLWNLS